MMQLKNSYDDSGSRKCRNKIYRNGLIALVTMGLLIVSITVHGAQSPGILNENESCSTSEKEETHTAPPAQTRSSEEGETNESNGKVVSETAAYDDAEESETNEGGGKETAVEIGYDYTEPVPESDRVENDYFEDAVFIGDSRTEGMLLYTGLSNTISYTNKGLMVDTVFTKPVINMHGEKISIMDALRETDFRKIYIMLGINETGWPNEMFIEKYCEMIDEVQNINPNAIIYVQEILPVTDSVSKTHSYVKNEKINEYNALIRTMAEEKHIYYIDVGNAVADADGCLPEDAAIDGIHLQKSYCEKWLDYLKKHTVKEPERQA